MTSYCIDTSSLVNLRLWRPRHRFPAGWNRIDSLIRTDRLVAPAAVLQELKQRDDDLYRWARRKNRRKAFKRHTGAHVGIARQIIHRFPDLVDQNSPTENADPFVVALAVQESKKSMFDDCVVVTEEVYRPGRTRIPHVCEAYELTYLTLHQMFRAEGWSF